MPNFDALRASNIGALSYICRPKVKPAELLALYPFDGDLNDISNYGRTCSTSDYSFTNDGPFGKCLSFNGTVIHDASTAWSIDFFGQFLISGSGVKVLNFSSSTQSAGLYGVNNDVICQITNTNLWFNTGVGAFAHYALTYDGSVISGYANGVRKFQDTKALNAQTTISCIRKAYLKISNLRVVGKCLTTGTTFPVPTGFYTGFEDL
ncbi:MAG: hypothetical protein IJQ31_14955 [Thermoguttaceae bacterium]|nr:hypothetical protein [Thermoguttaceae bacterium]